MTASTQTTPNAHPNLPFQSTTTPLSLLTLPSKRALTDTFVGQPLASLRTPALIVDRGVFKRNCERVTERTAKRGLTFRAHVKTHKTTEGVRLQAEAAGGVTAFIASTMPELWQLVESGLVEEGLIKDILYSLPVGADRLHDLDQAQQRCGDKAVIRVMVDHPAQIQAMDKFNSVTGRTGVWGVFVKVDGGGRRAGVPPTSQQLKDIVKAILATPHVEIHGFYSHFGQSYASKTLPNAAEYLHGEIDCVNSAAKIARSLGATGKWVLSVGATPTAHAAVLDADLDGGLEGELELHAGCYCMNDLQQLSTSLISHSDTALTVLARVVSVYPHRDEAMCDAGALAVSKDTGPQPGFGHVVSPKHLSGWDLGRISQEHGTLTHRPGNGGDAVGEIKVGDTVRILPQHACLVCASYPWIYVIEDGGDTVVDVWVTWKGW